MGRNNITGAWGEAQAAAYLRKKRYKIVGANYRCRFGEIDLIASNRTNLVFVEVKTRSSESYGDVYEAVTPRKMRNVILAAEAYMKQNEIDLPVRFDVVTVVPDGDTHRIEHIRDAFYPELE